MQRIRLINIESELLKGINNEAVTIIHLTTNFDENISPRFFLTNYQSVSNSLVMIHCFSDCLENKPNKLALIFPTIPTDWAEFDIIQDAPFNKRLQIFGIQRKRSGIYKLVC